MTTPLSVWMRRLVLLSHVALIVAIVRVSAPVIAVLLIVPLLLPLPGLLRGRDYTHAWATMLLAFYVGGWLAAGYATPAQKGVCFVIAALAAVDFVALNLFVKFRARERAAQRAMSDAAAH
jgi:uncharacterized membrane protein